MPLFHFNVLNIYPPYQCGSFSANCPRRLHNYLHSCSASHRYYTTVFYHIILQTIALMAPLGTTPHPNILFPHPDRIQQFCLDICVTYTHKQFKQYTANLKQLFKYQHHSPKWPRNCRTAITVSCHFSCSWASLYHSPFIPLIASFNTCTTSKHPALHLLPCWHLLLLRSFNHRYYTTYLFMLLKLQHTISFTIIHLTSPHFSYIAIVYVHFLFHMFAFCRCINYNPHKSISSIHIIPGNIKYLFSSAHNFFFLLYPSFHVCLFFHCSVFAFLPPCSCISIKNFNTFQMGNYYQL